MQQRGWVVNTIRIVPLASGQLNTVDMKSSTERKSESQLFHAAPPSPTAPCACQFFFVAWAASQSTEGQPSESAVEVGRGTAVLVRPRDASKKSVSIGTVWHTN